MFTFFESGYIFNNQTVKVLAQCGVYSHEKNVKKHSQS